MIEVSSYYTKKHAQFRIAFVTEILFWKNFFGREVLIQPKNIMQYMQLKFYLKILSKHKWCSWLYSKSKH